MENVGKEKSLVLMMSGDGPILDKYPEYARLIGLIVSNWNTIEIGLASLLAMAIRQNVQIVFPMVYALRNAQARLDVMEQALQRLFAARKIDQTDLTSVLAEARKVVSSRNVYAHAAYSIENGKVKMLDLQDGIPGLKDQSNKRHLPLTELQEAATRSHDLSMRVAKLMNAALLVQLQGTPESESPAPPATKPE